MASWFTNALDVLTPWNRGGEVQRRAQAAIQKKKKQQDQQSSAPSGAYPGEQLNQQNQPKVQRPDNLFAGLNQNLNIGQPSAPVTVNPNLNPKPLTTPPPQPGTVVHPGNAPQPPQNQPQQQNHGFLHTLTHNPVTNVTGSIGKAVVQPFVQLGKGVGQIPTAVSGEIASTSSNPYTRQAGIEAIRHAQQAAFGTNDSGTIAKKILGSTAGAELTLAAPGLTKGLEAGAADLLPKTAPNLIRNVVPRVMAGANIGGTFNTAATVGQGDTNPMHLAKAYTGGAVAGGALEGAAPVLSRFLPKFLQRNKTLVNDAEGETPIEGAATSEAVQPQQPTQVPIKAPKSPPVKVPVGTPVTDNPFIIPKIKELSGDFNFPTQEELRQISVNNQKNAADVFNATARPDRALEGITPRTTEPYKLPPSTVKGNQSDLIDQYAGFLKDVGEGNGVAINQETGTRVSNNVRFGDTGGKRMTKADWRAEAERQLSAGKAEPSHQQAFDEAANPDVQSLLAKGDQTQELPPGKPIEVKQATTIPVVDKTVVPTDVPETPGQGRPTAQAAPMADKTQAAANAPVVTPPTPLPAETQAILDNPKQFNKRQVAAARNQRKMARAVAKANEDTAAATARIETASPAAQSGEGFMQTGEFGKSANGGAYQKVSRSAEMQQALQETSQMSPGDAIQTARNNQLETGGFNRRDIRNIAAMFESKRIPRGTPEYNEARAILKEDGTVWGQTGALRNYTMRRTASAEELMNRYESKIYRLAEDPSKIDGKLFDQVDAAESTFTQARDDALTAYNRFTEEPTSANAKAYHAAQDAADKADKAARTTEYKVANKILKGNKDVQQVRTLEKMANDADMYQMDAVDASMLSGTGTFVRNLVNAAVGGVEENVFGRPAAFFSRKLTGEAVGGGAGRGTLSGLKKGSVNVVDASKARASNAGKNPLEHLKNWSTTGNELGNAVIDSQTTRNTLAHYTHVLKDQGYTGRELTDRASVMARQDPDNVGRVYAGIARSAAGLGGGITRSNKIETVIKNIISDTISGGRPNRVSEGTAKLATRMTIGFPTAIGRSTLEGVKRFTLGTPTFVKALRTSDPAERAILVKEGIKQAGTGAAVIPPLFYALGASGLITGAYPSDPDERAKWEREGISENSIKIGGNYYQLPSYLGAWALPGLFWASVGRNGGDFTAAATDTAKTIPALLPTDQMTNITDVINGRSDLGKFMAQMGAGTVRAATPAGALLNQLAKSFDPTKNDTTTGSNWENFIDKVLTGIPGASNTVPNKTDDAGNTIMNPKPVPLGFGAASAVQTKGQERSAQLQDTANNSAKKTADSGALNDPNLKDVLDDQHLQIYNKLKSGKEVDPKDLKSLQTALVKGVSGSEDTAYLEREQYDTNLAALKLKRELMSEDKTVKPSDIKKVDIAIKRGQVYKKDNISYDDIQAYEDTSLSDWRAMGDPKSDSYDPDTYQKLWALDEKLAKAGGSYKKDAPTKQKYSAKQSGSGGRGGRGGSSNFGGDFGQLKAGEFAPKIKSYETIDQQSGGVPVIKRVRPNIVHKIGSSG